MLGAVGSEDLGAVTSVVTNPASLLGKDDFLRILITQLTNQDPTRPMEDREFISQMAQFSSLEQMTQLNGEMSRVAGLLARDQATTLLGRTVEISHGASTITGTVREVRGVEVPQIFVNGSYYDYANVQRIIDGTDGTEESPA